MDIVFVYDSKVGVTCANARVTKDWQRIASESFANYTCPVIESASTNLAECAGDTRTFDCAHVNTTHRDEMRWDSTMSLKELESNITSAGHKLSVLKGMGSICFGVSMALLSFWGFLMSAV
jgi:hypothetical protein